MKINHIEGLREKNGKTRIRTMFLWFPVFDKNIGKDRWLEFAKVKEVFIFDISENGGARWQITEFLKQKGKNDRETNQHPRRNPYPYPDCCACVAVLGVRELSWIGGCGII